MNRWQDDSMWETLTGSDGVPKVAREPEAVTKPQIPSLPALKSSIPVPVGQGRAEGSR